MGPAAFAAVISSAFAFLAAHQGMLESWGVFFGTWETVLVKLDAVVPKTQVIVLELDTFKLMGIAVLVGLIGAQGAAAGHHGNIAINKVAAKKKAADEGTV